MFLGAAFIKETPTIRPRRKFKGHAHSIEGVIHLAGGKQMMTCFRDGLAASMELGRVENRLGKIGGTEAHKVGAVCLLEWGWWASGEGIP